MSNSASGHLQTPQSVLGLERSFCRGEMMLVRHPEPRADESLWGYLLRLTEQNGYSSPWNLLHLAGLKQSQIRTSGMDVPKLAEITSRSDEELRKIAFRYPEDGPRWSRLLGHRLLPSDLCTMSPVFLSRLREGKGLCRSTLASSNDVCMPRAQGVSRSPLWHLWRLSYTLPARAFKVPLWWAHCEQLLTGTVWIRIEPSERPWEQSVWAATDE